MRKGQPLDEKDKHFYCRKNLINKHRNDIFLDTSKVNENYLFDIQLENNE
jgi:hypothetical protein